MLHSGTQTVNHFSLNKTYSEIRLNSKCDDTHKSVNHIRRQSMIVSIVSLVHGFAICLGCPPFGECVKFQAIRIAWKSCSFEKESKICFYSCLPHCRKVHHLTTIIVWADVNFLNKKLRELQRIALLFGDFWTVFGDWWRSRSMAVLCFLRVVHNCVDKSSHFNPISAPRSFTLCSFSLAQIWSLMLEILKSIQNAISFKLDNCFITIELF